MKFILFCYFILYMFVLSNRFIDAKTKRIRIIYFDLAILEFFH